MSINVPAASVENAIERLFRHMVTLNASDLYLTADSPPVYRVDGVGMPGKHAATSGDVDKLANELMTHEQRVEFDKKLEMNLAIARFGERFRVNIFKQRGATGIVVRLIQSKIRTLAELGLPEVVANAALSQRGLVLLVGGTGSGKSTTLASMVDHRNATRSGHIVTIEDPMEFVHPHKQCVVTQREVGVDTRSYADALKSALRQAPDVVLIGEIRDAETMEAALAFADTGHLCLSTLHANNANQAMDRILNFFPSERQKDILHQLSLNIRAIISQRLLPSRNGGRAAALEILLDTPRVKDLIKRHEIELLKDAMEQSVNDGCQTFDKALYDLVVTGRISGSDALKAADSPNNLRLKLERLRHAQPQRQGLRLISVAAVTVPMMRRAA